MSSKKTNLTFGVTYKGRPYVTGFTDIPNVGQVVEAKKKDGTLVEHEVTGVSGPFDNGEIRAYFKTGGPVNPLARTEQEQVVASFIFDMAGGNTDDYDGVAYKELMADAGIPTRKNPTPENRSDETLATFVLTHELVNA